MVHRIARTFLAFCVATIVASQLSALRTGGLGGPPQGLAPLDALVGVIVGLIVTWRIWILTPVPKPEAATEASADHSWLKTLFQLILFLIVGTVLTALMSEPQQGAFSFRPRASSIVPVFLIALFAFGVMLIDKRRKRGQPLVVVPDIVARPAQHMARNAARSAGTSAAASAAQTVSGLAKSARGLGHLARLYQTGGGAGQDAANRLLVFCLVALGLALFVLGLAKDAGPAIILSSMALGTAAAVLHDRRVGLVLRFARLPRARDLAVMALSFATLFVLEVTIDIAVRPMAQMAPSALPLVVHGLGVFLAIAGAVLVCLPLLAGLVAMPPETDERPLWPLAAGLLGGEVAFQIILQLWFVLTSPVFSANPIWTDTATAPLAFPPLALILGAATACWYQALTADRRQGLDWDMLFPASILGAMGMTLLALIGCAAALALPATTWDAATFAGWLINCVVWLFVLLQVQTIRPSSTLRVVLGWSVLAIGYFGTILITSGLGAGHEWAPLLALVTVPAAMATWAFTALAMPRILRRILE